MTLAELTASRKLWLSREKYRYDKWHFYRYESKRPLAERLRLRSKWWALWQYARGIRIRRDGQIRAATPLRIRAYNVAVGLIGVMEHGGNNQGEKVMEIIRANGGVGPEPWCGDFMAYCYRLAGSKSVTRSWASVALFGGVTGVRRTTTPHLGDAVRFNFDHVGMFVRDLGNGYIETIEGNTGASGAVSDSTTGGDGVYRKRRHKSLVHDYLTITR